MQAKWGSIKTKASLKAQELKEEGKVRSSSKLPQSPKELPHQATSDLNLREANLYSTKIIRRYPNRKLYDTQKSRYVTLDDIAKMVRTKKRIVILDNQTRSDITALTLTQIIFEAEKKVNEHAPLSILSEIIRNGNGSMSSYLAKLDVFNPAEQAPVQEYVYDLINKKGPHSYGKNRQTHLNKGQMNAHFKKEDKEGNKVLIPGYKKSSHLIPPTLPGRKHQI